MARVLTLSSWEFVMILPEARSYTPTQVVPTPEFSAAISCLTSPLLTSLRLSKPNRNCQRQKNGIPTSPTKKHIIQYPLTTHQLPRTTPTASRYPKLQGIGLGLNNLIILRSRTIQTWNARTRNWVRPERPNHSPIKNHSNLSAVTKEVCCACAIHYDDRKTTLKYVISKWVVGTDGPPFPRTYLRSLLTEG